MVENSLDVSISLVLIYTNTKNLVSRVVSPASGAFANGRSLPLFGEVIESFLAIGVTERSCQLIEDCAN